MRTRVGAGPPKPHGSYHELVAPQMDEHLRTFLAERDALCPTCRYNLRSATTAICPECGGQLSIDAIEEAMRARATFVSPLARLIAGGVLLLFTLVFGGSAARSAILIVQIALVQPRFAHIGALAWCAFVITFVVMLWWVYIARWRGHKATRAKAILSRMAICFIPALGLWLIMVLAFNSF